MTLSDYDPKLLEFLYELTKLKRVMSYKDIAKAITIQGKKVSPKTVERWFKFLRRPLEHPNSLSKDRFDYFPKFLYEKLGLHYHYLFLDEPSENIWKNVPFSSYLNYALWLYDFSRKDSVLTFGFPFPERHSITFRDICKDLIHKDVVKSYSICPVKTGFMIYSPWHKVLDEKGVFRPEMNDADEIDRQMFGLRNYLNNLPEAYLDKEIRRNPLILPILFEYWRESKSSVQVWNDLQKKFGKDIWDFIPKKKEMSEGIGVKKVQSALNDIHRFGLVHQMKLVYMPLQLDNSFFFTELKFKDQSELLEKIKEIALISIQMTLYPKKNNEVFLIFCTDHKGLGKFFEIIGKKNIKRLFLSQHEKSLNLLTNRELARFNYKNLFNVNNLLWK